MLVWPSPKVHAHCVMPALPAVDRLANWTVSGPLPDPRPQADALVTGRLTVCKRTWILFCPWSSVEFALRAFDVAEGKTRWTASAKGTRVWKNERDLFQDAAKEIAAKVTKRWRTDP